MKPNIVSRIDISLNGQAWEEAKAKPFSWGFHPENADKPRQNNPWSPTCWIEDCLLLWKSSRYACSLHTMQVSWLRMILRLERTARLPCFLDRIQGLRTGSWVPVALTHNWRFPWFSWWTLHTAKFIRSITYCKSSLKLLKDGSNNRRDI